MTIENKTWVLRLQDAADGSGDAILELPEDLLAIAGWIEGDTLEFIERDEGYLIQKVA